MLVGAPKGKTGKLEKNVWRALGEIHKRLAGILQRAELASIEDRRNADGLLRRLQLLEKSNMFWQEQWGRIAQLELDRRTRERRTRERRKPYKVFYAPKGVSLHGVLLWHQSYRTENAAALGCQRLFQEGKVAFAEVCVVESHPGVGGDILRVLRRGKSDGKTSWPVSPKDGRLQSFAHARALARAVASARVEGRFI